MKSTALIFCLLTFHQVNAQGPEGFDAFNNLSNASSSMFRSFDSRYKGIVGFPTIFEKFVTGNVIMKRNNQEYQNMELNLDLVTGELLYQSPKFKDPFVVSAKEVNSFTLKTPEGSTIIFHAIVVAGKILFAEPMYDGQNIKLYRHAFKVIEKASSGGPYNLNDKRYDEFVEGKKYFTKKPNEISKQIQLKKSEIQKILPGNKSLAEYLKSKKPNLKEAEDVRQLFTFIDQELAQE